MQNGVGASATLLPELLDVVRPPRPVIVIGKRYSVAWKPVA